MPDKIASAGHGGATGSDIVFTGAGAVTALGPEGYTLDVTEQSVVARASGMVCPQSDCHGAGYFLLILLCERGHSNISALHCLLFRFCRARVAKRNLGIQEVLFSQS